MFINLLRRLGVNSELKKRPKSRFNPGELVIYNQSEKAGNESDELYLIKFSRFGTCTNNLISQWYYDGNKLELKKTSSKGLPYAPFFRTGCINTPEEYLHKLDEIKTQNK